MGAGDTVAGQIRIMRLTTLGHTIRVAGPIGQSLVDHKADPENSIYFNPPKGMRLPVGASSMRTGKKGMWYPGEKLQVQHKASALAEAVVYNADEFFIGVAEEDLNTKDPAPRTLTAPDTDLGANPTTSTTAWVTIFEYTCPDRRRFCLAGAFNVAATEAA